MIATRVLYEGVHTGACMGIHTDTLAEKLLLG